VARTLKITRYALSAPFYLLAFGCHLLTAFFTFIAECIAGNRPGDFPKNMPGSG